LVPAKISTLKVYICTVSFFFSALDDDEEGDRVTVRSDEELRAMLDWVCNNM